MTFAGLFHPNHLLYNALGYAIYSAAVWIAPNIRAICVLQAINVVLSVLAGYIVFLLARRITNADGVPFFCWLLFAAGATWWKFSTDADAYVVSVLLLLLSAVFLVRSKPLLATAALCHGTAMLFHELAIFTYVPVLAWILVDTRKSAGRRFLIALGYCAGTAGMVAGAYWLCYQEANRGESPTVLSWITSYSKDKGFTHSFGEFVKYYPVSYLKLFAGGKLVLIREFFSLWECVALLLCIAFVICAILLFRRPRVSERTTVEPRGLLFFWAWFVGYACFLGAWDAGSAFHKLFVWPAIVLLIGVYVARTGYLRAFTSLAAVLAAWNFGAFIHPHSQAAADPVLVLAQRVNRELPQDATVYYRMLAPDDWYLEYFAPGREWKALPQNAVASALARASSGPVCLETTALAGFNGAVDRNLKWDLVNSAHNVRLECLKRLP